MPAKAFERSPGSRADADPGSSGPGYADPESSGAGNDESAVP
ncbi:hypothetical protein [Desertivibrio insolitus]|nr:hypothetical protein [Herbiconiux sp. SYSU D00978]